MCQIVQNEIYVLYLVPSLHCLIWHLKHVVTQAFNLTTSMLYTFAGDGQGIFWWLGKVKGHLRLQAERLPVL